MDSLKWLKRIMSLAVFLFLVVFIYRYNENIEQYVVSIKNKYDDVGKISKIVDDLGQEIAGVQTKELVFLTPGREIKLDVEIADTEEKRATGLMNREYLCQDCGMLFIFNNETSSGFWMKNCEIPLDLIFLDKNGRIIDIKKEFKPCKEDECPAYSPSDKYRYVIEVNSTWTDENNVNVGDVVVGITSDS